MKINVLKRELVIGDNNEDVENVGKLKEIYARLVEKHADEINFRLFSFEKFLGFVDDQGYENEDLNYSNVYYDLRYDPVYSNN